MGPFAKKLIKAQEKKQCSNSPSPTKLGSTTEDSDSDVQMESLNPRNRSCARTTATNISLGHAANDTSSSDDLFSDTQSSEHEMKDNEVQSMKVVSLSSNDDLAVSLSRKRQEKDLKNQASNTLQHGTSESDDDSDAESRKEILRSAEKRIIRKVSTSESDSRNKRVLISDKYKSTSSSESDSAPEDVTFEVGRKQAMEVIKQRVDSIHQEKLRKKEQRKKKLENFKKQKEEKLIRLKQRQRNVENASSSSSTELAPKSKPLAKQNAMTSKDKSITVGKKTYFSSESDNTERKTDGLKSDKKQCKNLKRLSANILDSLPDLVAHRQQKQVDSVENEDCIQPKKMRSKTNSSELQWDTDYIPLDSNTVTQFGVVPLNKVRKKTVGEEAAAFRQNMLYGNTVRRAPANLNSVRQQKLKISGMDRLVTPHVQ